MKTVKLARHVMRVQTANELDDFYVGSLGMNAYGTAEQRLYGYDSEQCLLEFRGGALEPYEPASNDFYWKIGITLPDLDAAVTFLREQGHRIDDPYQFRDIGYMTKVRDPNGFVIELLQQGFEGNSNPIGDGHPVATGAIFAHITLRVTDIASAGSWCENQLGMRLMSVQPVDDFEFCLYFYSWNGEDLPHEDLEAVENREWLWRRPYTLIELQHLTANDARVRKTDLPRAGFDGFAFSSGSNGQLQYVTLADLTALR